MLQLNNTVTAITGKMSAAISGPLSAAMTIYIVLYGVAILRGTVQEPIIDFIVRGLKLIVIWTVAANAGSYSEWAGNIIVIELPKLVGELLGTSDGIASDSISSVTYKLLERLDGVLSVIPTLNVGLYIFWSLLYVVVLIVMGLISAIVFAMSLFAYVSLSLLAAVGPLFVAFALFNFSRGWFFSWLGQILNFFILALLVNILGIFASSFIADVFNAGAGLDPIIKVGNTIMAAIIFTFLFFLLPSIASGLSSGAQLSTGVAQRAVERRLGRSGGGGGNNNSRGSATRN